MLIELLGKVRDNIAFLEPLPAARPEPPRANPRSRSTGAAVRARRGRASPQP
jgi:hypothetical protein